MYFSTTAGDVEKVEFQKKKINGAWITQDKIIISVTTNKFTLTVLYKEGT